MTDTTTLETADSAAEKPRRSGSLSAMRLAELQGLASSMGIAVTGKMRKSDLVAAIRARQSGEDVPSRGDSDGARGQGASGTSAKTPDHGQRNGSDRSDRSGGDSARAGREDRADERAGEAHTGDGGRDHGHGSDRAGDAGRRDDDRPDNRQDDRRDGRGNRDDNRGESRDDNRGDNRKDRQDKQDKGDGGRSQGDNRSNQGDNRGNRDDDGGGRGRRRSRNRNRNKRRGRGGEGEVDNEPQVSEDDVLVPVAGILDVLDNYAFVRTSGYLPGPNDVYVPMGMVKRHGLRKGDAVTGAVKAPRDGEEQQQGGGKGNRQKYNPLVRLDSVNGMSSEDAKKRVEFTKLTPLYPQERLRLETEPNIVTTRIIDLVAPIGKGQRGLIVSPPKAGKTLVLQAIANAITTNNPETHLMIVLVDERPEEVTDMQRTVKGEVIASTFDRPADDHTTVAELAIERAKRLVEMGHDVVVLLDSITRLGRAYNLAAPASGRILSGGVDSSALYPPKRFFGAARNIENGGSLTILATALVETGSKMDEVIFEEFKGTGNMELRLSRQLADRRIFPAVDVNPSGTRREEILLGPDELKIMWKLRRVLSALDPQQGIELLLDRLKKTKSNVEFLMQVQQTSSIRLDDEDDD